MKTRLRKRSIGLALSCITPFAFLLALEFPAVAQQGPVTDRERNVSEIERVKNDTASHDAAVKQANEDFSRIQTDDVDMLKVFSASKPPDYKRISDDAADIKKRATRLKDYLVLPPTAKDEKRKKMMADPAPEELESSVPALKDLIQGFVKNPVFQQTTQRADYRDLAKARRDLDDIIDLTSKIRKTSDRMSKPAGNSK
jgi:hypothetical protein